MLNIMIANFKLVPVGLYLLPPADVSVLSSIMQLILAYDVEDVLIVRDFNLAPCPDLDRLHLASRWCPSLAHWAGAFSLTDVWRHPAARECMCHSASFKTLFRIDLAYVSQSMLRRVSAVNILPRGISDHTPLLVTLSLTPRERGCGGCLGTG